MKGFKIVVMLVAVAAIAFAGTAAADCGHCGKHQGGGKGHGMCAGKGDCAGYDKAATSTFEATVVKMNTEECKGCGMSHVDLVVEMKDKKVNVRLGPSWYIDKQDEMLKEGDVVEVFASKVEHGDKHMLVAGKVIKGEDVLMLRDENGLPMWRGWRRGKV